MQGWGFAFIPYRGRFGVFGGRLYPYGARGGVSFSPRLCSFRFGQWGCLRFGGWLAFPLNVAGLVYTSDYVSFPTLLTSSPASSPPHSCASCYLLPCLVLVHGLRLASVLSLLGVNKCGWRWCIFLCVAKVFRGGSLRLLSRLRCGCLCLFVVSLPLYSLIGRGTALRSLSLGVLCSWLPFGGCVLFQYSGWGCGCQFFSGLPFRLAVSGARLLSPLAFGVAGW